MALRQKPSGKWEVYYRNPVSGRRESFTVATKHEGIKEDALIRYRIKYEPEYFQSTAVIKVEEKNEDFESVTYAYLASKGYTKQNLYHNVNHLRIWLEAFHGVSIKSITDKAVLGIRESMVHNGLKASTIIRRMASFRAVMRWAEMQGMIERCPRIPTNPKVMPKPIVPPSPEEIVTLLKVASPHFQRIIIIGSQFGLRVGRCELLSLRWDDVDLKRGILRCRSSSKNPKEPYRELPIRKELIPVFRHWRDEDIIDGILPETVIHYRRKPVHKINEGWQLTCKRAGITRYIRPYDLRHAFATEMIAAGVDIGTVAKMMGHANAHMVLEHYQHVLDSHKKAAVELLPMEYCESDIVCLKGSPSYPSGHVAKMIGEKRFMQ